MAAPRAPRCKRSISRRWLLGAKQELSEGPFVTGVYECTRIVFRNPRTVLGKWNGGEVDSTSESPDIFTGSLLFCSGSRFLWHNIAKANKRMYFSNTENTGHNELDLCCLERPPCPSGKRKESLCLTILRFFFALYRSLLVSRAQIERSVVQHFRHSSDLVSIAPSPIPKQKLADATHKWEWT